MTEFINATESENFHGSHTKGNRGKINLETLMEIMADIELKKRSDPRAVITLLRVLEKTDPDLHLLQQAKTEKHIRELSSLPSNMFATQKNEVEMMKKLSKSLLKSWADKRRL